MRRKIPILLSLMLLVSSSGFTLNKHYCNGKLVNVFLLPHVGKCCDSSMVMNSDSCKDVFFAFSSENTIEFLTAKITFTRPSQRVEFTKPFLLIDSYGDDHKIQRVGSYFLPFANAEIYLQVESFLM